MTPRAALLLGLVLLGCVPALGTQVVAHQLRYAAWLGKPLGTLAGIAFYPPQQYVVWYWHYAWYYPVPFDWGLGAMAGWMVGSAVLLAWRLKRSGWQRGATQADAAWATPRDIRKAGLFVRIRK